MSVQLELAISPASISSAVGSLARTSLAPGSEPASSAASEAACGENSGGSPKSSRRASSSSRTSRAARGLGCARCGAICMNLATAPMRSRSAPATSGRPIDACGSSSSEWPTPTVQYRATYGRRRGVKHLALAGAVAMWPTPTVTSYGSGQNGCPRDGRESFAGKGAPSLSTAVRWPTPRAHDARGGAGRSSNPNAGGPDLRTAIAESAGPALWPTPQARDDHGPSGRTENLPNAIGTKSRAALNPRWVLALMGFPLEWFDGLPAEVLNKRLGNLRASKPT